MSKPSKSKRHASQQSVNGAVKSICDIMRRSNCAGALQYVPELTWILFLRILDEREEREVDEADAQGVAFTPALAAPYRWCDWAAPDSPMRQDKNASVWQFVHEELLPALKQLKDQPEATPRQKVISEIMSSVDRSRIDSEKNFLDVLDKVDGISSATVDDTHVFTLSQVYEGLLLKMGEKGNDGGQFFTPREVIRAMVKVLDPQIGKTVYDPGCGTGGFLAQTYEYMVAQSGEKMNSVQLDTLRHRTFYGREKDNVVYPIALANLVLHGIDEPHIWHGNALSQVPVYEGLFNEAPAFFDYVLMNPPFGGKEGPAAQTPYNYKSSATQVLFIQNVLQSMKPGSRCGIVLDEGLLFRIDDTPFVQTKQQLLEECDVYCIVSLPGGVFTSAGAGVKTNLVFFDKGRPTEHIWYYDLSDVKVGKKTPLTLAHFEEFFSLLPGRAGGERSWTVDFAARLQAALEAARPHREEAENLNAEAKLLEDALTALRKAKASTPVELRLQAERWKEVRDKGREATQKAVVIERAPYDLKAVNPNRRIEEDRRTPEELLALIEDKGHEVDAALARLRSLVVATSSNLEVKDAVTAL